MIGLGDVSTVQQAQMGVSLAATGATTGVAVAASSGAIAASTAALAVPIIGAVAAGITLLLSFAFKPDLKKIATTHIVNQAEPYLKQNVDTFLQLVSTGQANEQTRQAAEQVFNGWWQQVVNACSQGDYGSAGRNCIGDRQRGGKWDWFKLYYDPIVNAKISAPVAGDVSSSIAAMFGTGGGSWGLVLGGGLLLAALVD